MKKINLLLATGAMAATLFGACSKDKGNDTGSPTSTGTNLRGVISSNMTLTKDKTWTLRGYVYVTDGAVLTIEPGTKIVSKKDSAGVLIITRGAKIDARGTVASPIVFTSGESTPISGDLGGVIVAGKATVNGNHAVMEGGIDVKYSQFGGTDDNDNSGVLQYVRIEYAGKAVTPADEVNGLSMYGVGRGTTVDHIQVIKGQDDAFEFFGGSFNAKYLVAYKCADDDFDFDDGFHGNLQYLISFKDPQVTDLKTGTNAGDYSNNLEWDNNGNNKPYNVAPNTHARISNLTAIGPNNATSEKLVDFGFGARFRRGAQFEIVNSVFLGSQKASFSIETSETAAAFKSGVSVYKNNVIQSVATTGAFNLGTDVPANVLTLTEMQALATDVTVLTNPADAKLTDAFNVASPKLMPATGSMLLGGASFTGNFTAANGFDTTTLFKGALGTTDWTTGWTVFN